MQCLGQSHIDGASSVRLLDAKRAVIQRASAIEINKAILILGVNLIAK
jgi:hypothetical protein